MIHIAADGVYQDGVKISTNIDDAAWNQGVLQTYGIYQRSVQTFTCTACGHSYQARMRMRFVPDAGLLVDYEPAPDPGCPKGCPKQ